MYLAHFVILITRKRKGTLQYSTVQIPVIVGEISVQCIDVKKCCEDHNKCVVFKSDAFVLLRYTVLRSIRRHCPLL